MDLGVVSPQVLTRKALCALLAPMDSFRVTLDVEGAIENFDLIQKARPDILLLDILSPASDLQVISRIRSLLPSTKVLLLSDGTDEEFQVRAIRAGAQGCVSRSSEPEVLEKALRLVGQGEIWVSHQAAARIIGKLLRSHDHEDGDNSLLTHREWEILEQVANGFRNKEIASRLFVSENTVKTHLYTIYRKLQVSTRLGAALHYFQQAPHRSRHSPGMSPEANPKPAAAPTGEPKRRAEPRPERDRMKP